MIQKVCIVGSGNVASNLAYSLHQKVDLSIWSRNAEKREAIANSLHIKSISNIQDIQIVPDLLFILCINDDAIQEVCLKLVGFFGPYISVVHTSGSANIEVLSACNQFGVFYPLQTFTQNKFADFTQIPICIEANEESFQSNLVVLAKKLSQNVNLIDSNQRTIIHLSAVFANNFSNRMIAISQAILEKNQLSDQIIIPLIAETFTKILTHKAKEIQTGPAKRKDEKIINKHIALLENLNEDWAKLYEILSDDIYKAYN